MSNIAILNRVLSVREIEKNDAQKAHHNATEKFETVATQLYKLLKKKEDAQKQYEESLSDIAEIEKIKEQLAYIDKLNRDIIQLQEEVNKARRNMEVKQEELTDAYIEVKKFEKVIENRIHEKIVEEQKKEQSFMDEISVRQYFDQK